MYFPMIINMTGEKCLIAGGGRVALHKAKLLYSFGADITVVSPDFCRDFLNSGLPFDEELLNIDEAYSEGKEALLKKEAFIGENGQHVDFLRRKISAKDITNSDIVVAATGNIEIDKMISVISKEHRIPVNVVDVPELCTFFFPAMISEGPLNISVSTSGKSPVAAASIRNDIKNNLPDFTIKLIERMGEIRPIVTKEDLTHDEKREVFSSLYEYGSEHDGEIPDEVVGERLWQILTRKK